MCDGDFESARHFGGEALRAAADSSSLLIEAMLLNNLALPLAELREDQEARKKAGEALDRLKRYRREAQASRCDDSFRRNHAVVQLNCAVLNLTTARAPRSRSLDLANEAIRELNSLPRGFPGLRADKAMALNNLGCLFHCDGQEERAVRHLRVALRHFRRLSTDGQVARGWPVCLNNLVNCNNRNGHLHHLAFAARRAVELYAGSGNAWDEDRILTYATLARVLLQSGDEEIEAAHEILQEAANLLEALRRRLDDAHARERFVGQFRDLLDLIPSVALRRARRCAQRGFTATGDLDKVVVSIEAAKARRLLDLLEQRASGANPRGVPTELLDRYRASQDTLLQVRVRAQTRATAWPKALREISPGPVSPDQLELRDLVIGGQGHDVRSDWSSGRLQKTLESAKRAHIEALQAVRRHDPTFRADGPHPLAAEQIQRFLRGRETSPMELWAVSFLCTRDSVLAAVVFPNHAPVVIELPLPAKELEASISKGFPNYARKKDASDRRKLHQRWLRGLQTRCDEWAQLITEPVFKAVAAAGIRLHDLPEHLLLVPDGVLHRIPLHALPLPSEFAGGTLADHCAVMYSPSLAVAVQAGRRPPCPKAASILVGNVGDLPFAQLEAAAFRLRYPGTEALIGGDASREWVMQAMRQPVALAHFTGHMTAAGQNDPLAAALHLRDGPVELRDLYAELRSGPDLVVLNGCSSGVLSEWGGKNPEGLSTGFLHGGAAQVVSTLWPVEDLTSALLLDRFHAELTALHRPTVAQALRRASNWLRGTGAAHDALTNPEAVLCALENLCKRATEQGTTLDTPVMDHIKHCAAKIAALEPATPPFSRPGHWAAHMIHGAGWRPSAA